MLSTPFHRWDTDPHGTYYDGDRLTPRYSDRWVAGALIGRPMIGTLTIAKERLRWLSRAVLKVITDETPYNETRATMLRGDLTDDQLSNCFYLTEHPDDLKAGAQRILWLSGILNDAKQYPTR